MSEAVRKGILLVGPTSSGKTPLGDMIEQQGLGSLTCAHFDFGAKFREAASEAEPAPPLDDSDIAVIRQSMATGALLTEEQFYIARKILESFLIGLDYKTAVLLNGMPRHEGQARGIMDIIDVVCVVELTCDKETILARIRCDTGGDRAGRQDDMPELVARKLDIYEKQTRPLIDFYKNKSVPVLTETVTVVSTAPDIIGQIEPAFGKLELR